MKTTSVILYQLDGKIPNLALMRIGAHYLEQGAAVELRWTHNVQRQLWDTAAELVFASLIFQQSRPHAERLLAEWPDAVIGGTGWDLERTLEDVGVLSTRRPNYALYPKFRQSIGFTQRGCRLRCPFCVVPRKEGAIRSEERIGDIWRGDPWPREILLLDNDFFGQPSWPSRIAELLEGDFKVSFNQGINARFLNDEAAAAIASVNYRDDSMKVRRIYTAWDNLKDERRLFEGLERLVRYGVKPDHIMCYLLVGFWPGETLASNLYRIEKLRDFGARPYPMPYVRTRELVGLQRWVIGAYDKRVSWDDWEAADYLPRRLGVTT